MSSLATALREELARLLEPLIVASGSAERWPLVLSLVGHTADVAGDPGVRAALDDLAALADLSDVDVETWEGIQAILVASAGATRALHELERAAGDPALGERVKGIGPELAEQLTTIYLRRFHPGLFRVATIFGIVEPRESRAPQPVQLVGDTPMREAWLRDELHLDRVGPLLRDPGAALRTAYFPNDLRTASDAHIAADRLFPLLRAALDEMGLASSLERRALTPDETSDVTGDGDHFNSPEPDPDAAPPLPPVPDLAPYHRSTLPRMAIRVPQLQADGSLAGTFLGIDVVASSLEHPGAIAGLIVELTGALNWTQSRGPWTIKLETDGQVPAFSIGPEGMKLAPLGSALTGATGRLSATLGAEGAQAFSIGDPNGTRLELGRVLLGADFSATPAHTAAALTMLVEKAVLALARGDGDGFLASLLPADGLKAEFDLGVTLSSDKGLTLHGKGGLEATIPVGLSLGGVSLKTLTVGLRAVDAQLTAEVSVSLSAVIGPVQASLDRIGVQAGVTFPDGGGNIGVADLAIGFQPPRGAGLAIDAGGILTGGGFLFRDPVQELYAGVVQLSLQERLTLTAFGLIATKMPDGSRGFSMIVFITAEGFQPIPLGMGFTLNGIGGMVAIHRSFDEDVLRAGLKNDTLGALLFPRDPIANAPAIIAALAAAFPAMRGSYLLGLLVRIGWFTPPLVLLDLALILQLGARRRLLVLGRISALLPSPDNDLVRLILDSIGVIDFDQGTVSIDAILVDSRLAHKFPLTGEMALRARWSSGPGSTIVLAVGGLNPHFAPPEGLPMLRRVAIALSSGNNPRLTCEAYFAITANTVQFGARAELYAAAYGFSVEGDVGFDVLIQIAPLHFLAEFNAKVQLKRGSSNLFMVSVEGQVEGPRPLRVSGRASFSIFWCDFTVRFDKTLIDGEPPPLPPAIDVLAQLSAALSLPQSWTAQRARGHTQGVALRALPPSSSQLVLEPLGRLVVKQQVVPLNTGRDIEIFGGAPVRGARRFRVTATLNGTSQRTDSVQDQFAPAQFFELSDDEKLAAPSFEAMDAGLVFGDEAVDFDASEIVPAPLQYEQIVIDDLAAPPPPPAEAQPRQTYTLTAERLVAMSRSGAAARAPIRSAGRARFRVTGQVPAATLLPPDWRIVPLADGAPATLDPAVKTWSEHLAALTTLNHGAATWQIVPAHELND